VERLIGTLRRECLDHVVALNETHLRRLLRDYLIYYHSARTHLSLPKDAPELRPVECPDEGRIVERPMVGGLHPRYTRASRRKIRPACGGSSNAEVAGRPVSAVRPRSSLACYLS
jgi:hypothetical protein